MIERYKFFFPLRLASYKKKLYSHATGNLLFKQTSLRLIFAGSQSQAMGPVTARKKYETGGPLHLFFFPFQIRLMKRGQKLCKLIYQLLRVLSCYAQCLRSTSENYAKQSYGELGNYFCKHYVERQVVRILEIGHLYTF